MHDRVVEILISATFRIHRDISFFFDQKPERNFFGEQCYCGCTSPVNKDIEQINVPQYIALETVNISKMTWSLETLVLVSLASLAVSSALA